MIYNGFLTLIVNRSVHAVLIIQSCEAIHIHIFVCMAGVHIGLEFIYAWQYIGQSYNYYRIAGNFSDY